MNTHIYVKLTRPEGYEDIHPDLVIEDAGIKHVFEPEDVTGEVESLKAECLEEARLNGMGSEREARLLARVSELEATIKSHGIPVKTATGGQSHYCTKEEV